MLEVKTIRKERRITAREAAERLGVTPRTIVNYQALERSEYLARAADRRKRVWQLRSNGTKWAEIADALGVSKDAVRSLYYQEVRRLRDKQKNNKNVDNLTMDLF